MPNDLSSAAYQSADFLKNLLVSHGTRLIHLIPLPKETGLVAPALLHMPVQAVVRNVGLASSEELYLNLAIVLVEIGLDMLLLELQATAAPHVKAVRTLNISSHALFCHSKRTLQLRYGSQPADGLLISCPDFQGLRGTKVCTLDISARECRSSIAHYTSYLLLPMVILSKLAPKCSGISEGLLVQLLIVFPRVDACPGFVLTSRRLHIHAFLSDQTCSLVA